MAEVKADAKWHSKAWGTRIYPQFRLLRERQKEEMHFLTVYESAIYECVKPGNCSPFQRYDILRIWWKDYALSELTRYPVAMESRAHKVTRKEVGLPLCE